MDYPLKQREVRLNTLRTAATLVEREDRGPMRPVGRRRGARPGGLYFSQKMGRHLGWESKNERNSFFHAEANPDIATYREQPHTLRVRIDGKLFSYTPDREDVYRDGRVVVVEVKDVFEEARDPAYTAKLDRCAEIYRGLGWDYQLVEKVDIERKPQFDVISKIQSHRRVAVSPPEVRKVLNALRQGSAPLSDLRPMFDFGPDLPPRKWTGLSRSAFGLGGADIAQ
ncbi:hypothetical protein [Brevundimonas aurantiaca]|uniref:hypothetical protein n=1 Tax=Brevundimonas aurantiaca TaxID=74316 RepID=UPI00174D35D3|nr:hypothetical protein [Brevundimonas aurantiaca]